MDSSSSLTMESSSLHPPPLVTPPSRRSKVTTLCLYPPNEDPRSPEEGDDADSPLDSPLFHKKKRQLRFLPQKKKQPHLPENLPLRELLLLSPTRRSRTTDAENIDPSDVTPKRRSKSNVGRSTRRSRGRPSKVAKEERQLGFFEEEIVKLRRRRRKKHQQQEEEEKEEEQEEERNKSLDDQIGRYSDAAEGGERAPPRGIFELISDLVLWRDAAKSSLSFGFGSLCFLSSCFWKDLSFNFVSTIAHLGLFALALAFLRDSFSQRWGEKRWLRYTLKEDDILKTIKFLLPTVNAGIELVQEVFSGDPSMTLKVAPVLLFMAKFSHFVTLRRLLAIGFFVGFTVPRFFSCYSRQIKKSVESFKSRSLETWVACRHKRMVALSCGTIFWNVLGVRARIIAVFFSVVILRYHQQQKSGEATERVEKEDDEVVIGEEATKEL